MADMDSNHEWWWEPRWSFVPRECREFQKSLPLRSWIRIIVAFAVILIPVGFIINANVPGLQFNWIAAFFISIAIVASIHLRFLLVAVIMPHLVVISREGIRLGFAPGGDDSRSLIRRSEIKLVRLTFHNDGRHYLRFQTDQGCRRIGLVPHVNLDTLHELLGDDLIIRDCRRRIPICSKTY
jgi:hypothetical protein